MLNYYLPKRNIFLNLLVLCCVICALVLRPSYLGLMALALCIINFFLIETKERYILSVMACANAILYPLCPTVVAILSIILTTVIWGFYPLYSQDEYTDYDEDDEKDMTDLVGYLVNLIWFITLFVKSL